MYLYGKLSTIHDKFFLITVYIVLQSELTFFLVW